MNIQIEPKANQIIHLLQQHGFAAYAVGGCVRNALMGLEPHDWDVCTDAKPDALRAVFGGYETHDYGLKHGTLVVMADGEPFEVTTYRIDGVYADSRRPESVTFTDDLTRDLSRRDFTVNAMAYNDERGLQDPFGGAEDLRRGVLRCVGVPDDRFREDALRILRGVRFAAVYGFQAERETAQALHRNARLLDRIARERVREELLGMLCGAQVTQALDEFRDVIAAVIPELAETFGVRQVNKHHCCDVWGHIIRSVGAVEAEPLLRMTMLLHDIGKPRARTTDADGVNHFKGHQQISAALAEPILRRLRCPNRFTEDCLQLILWHDVRFDGSTRQVKRVLQQLGKVQMRRLFQVQRADIAAQSDYRRAEKLASVALAQRQTEQILAEHPCLSLKDLAVNGSDLKKLGYPDGRIIGDTLRTLLDAVIDERVENTRESLLHFLQTK